MMNSFTYAALNTDFAYIGNHAVWLSYLMRISAAVEPILIAILAGVSWCRKQR